MKKNSRTFNFVPVILISFLLITSCLSQAFYDDYVYKETISAKVDALNLISKATNDYASLKNEVENLNLRMQKIYEYEKGRNKNEESIKMWEIMLDPNRKLLAGVLKRWQDKGTLSQGFIDQFRKQLSEAFDVLIGFELRKLKKESISPFLN